MLMASSSAKPVMEADPLQCPRCNSSNTKFCYYNNYSLSQPRHFCKACKRYWTRGGTLRNVPIGGGYRKTKKFKRHPPPPAPATPPNHINNPFYSMPSNFNFPFSEIRVSSESPRFHDLPRTDGPRSGFSPYLPTGSFDQNFEDRADFISFGSSSSNFAQHHRSYEEMQMVVGNGQIGRESSHMNSSSYLWNSNNVTVWFDPSSSLPSLI